MKYLIGLDIGATKIEGILINEQGRILKQEKAPTQKSEKDFLNTIFNLIEQLKVKKMLGDKVSGTTKVVSGIGLGAPGRIENGKIIRLNNLPKIKNLNLKKIIQNKFKIKTLIDNDANCFALAEAKIRKKENLIGLTLGSGLGGGIIINNQIYRGHNNLAGEFGQMFYQGKTIEDFCSAKGFKLLAQRYRVKSREPRELAQLAKKGDQLAQNLWDEFGRHLGHLINILANAFNPETIILGGSISQSFSLFKKSMAKSFQENLSYPVLKKTKITKSSLKHAGALGAAFLHKL